MPSTVQGPSEPSSSESTALISDADTRPQYGSPILDAAGIKGASSGEPVSFNVVSQGKHQIGVLSAISLIFNRMIGTGIYATPSLVLRASGSVGMFLVMWVLGAVITSTGLAVYVEFGTGLPRSGGEKNYLEYVYRKPKLLVTCCFAVYTCLFGWAAANSVVFGEYMIHALGGSITQWNTRFMGFACLTTVTLIHALRSAWGLRLQNILALIKIVTLVLVILSGLLAFLGWLPLNERPQNFDNLWEGTSHDPNAFVTALFNVVWTFVGYSNAHYALSETRDPVRTIRSAAPLAMLLVIAMYFLVNMAYLAVVSKEDIRDGGRVVAAYFFRNLFGGAAERALSLVVSLSTLGNILVVSFTQSRVIKELGKEGVLPYSTFISNNAPYDAPSAALAVQWIMCGVWMFLPPPGDAFNFVLNLQSYPYALINIGVSGGLLWLYLSPSRREDWHPPYRAGLATVIVFFLSNMFLAIAPLLPPSCGFSPYERLPYWSHVVATVGILILGISYWSFWTKSVPTRGVITLSG